MNGEEDSQARPLGKVTRQHICLAASISQGAQKEGNTEANGSRASSKLLLVFAGPPLIPLLSAPGQPFFSQFDMQHPRMITELLPAGIPAAEFQRSYL